MQKKEETDRFEVEDDDGNEYIVIEYTTFVSFHPLSGGVTWRPGTRSYRTDENEPVNMIDDETFKLVMSEKTVKRI